MKRVEKLIPSSKKKATRNTESQTDLNNMAMTEAVAMRDSNKSFPASDSSITPVREEMNETIITSETQCERHLDASGQFYIRRMRAVKPE